MNTFGWIALIAVVICLISAAVSTNRAKVVHTIITIISGAAAFSSYICFWIFR